MRNCISAGMFDASDNANPCSTSRTSPRQHGTSMIATVIERMSDCVSIAASFSAWRAASSSFGQPTTSALP